MLINNVGMGYFPQKSAVVNARNVKFGSENDKFDNIPASISADGLYENCKSKFGLNKDLVLQTLEMLCNNYGAIYKKYQASEAQMTKYKSNAENEIQTLESDKNTLVDENRKLKSENEKLKNENIELKYENHGLNEQIQELKPLEKYRGFLHIQQIKDLGPEQICKRIDDVRNQESEMIYEMSKALQTGVISEKLFAYIKNISEISNILLTGLNQNPMVKDVIDNCSKNCFYISNNQYNICNNLIHSAIRNDIELLGKLYNKSEKEKFVQNALNLLSGFDEYNTYSDDDSIKLSKHSINQCIDSAIKNMNEDNF